MAGSFDSLFQSSFAGTATVTVTHNLDRVQVAVLVRVGDVARNDLIESVVPSSTDPRNEVIITLSSAQSGEVLVLDTDYIFANIPTPEAASRGENTVHTNVAGEIAGVAAKGTPVDDDLLLIEDSEAGNAKKRVLLSDLPGGGGGSGDVTGPASSVDHGVVTFDGTTGKVIQDTGLRHYGASATDPTSPTPAAGDRYFNTALGMEMTYDAGRSKWLSSESWYIIFVYNGRANNRYMKYGNLSLAATRGICATRNVTVTELSFVRRSNNAQPTYTVYDSGSATAAALQAASNTTNDQADLTVNVDIAAGAILGAFVSGGEARDTTFTVKMRYRV